MNKELVIAKYARDVSWIEQINPDVKIIIYNKNLNTLINNEILIENNVGRCVHTFFYHICTRYNSLSDITFFAQDYPFDHSPDLINIINNFTLDYMPDNEMSNICHYDWHTPNNDISPVPYSDIRVKNYYYPLGNCILTEPSGVTSGHIKTDLDGKWNSIFKNSQLKKFYTMVAAGHFAITKEGILCKPLSFYENIKNMLETGGEFVPYEIERLEAYIFNPLYT